MDIIFTIAPLFFLIALIYSSVGFGGGSSYLAIMALAAFPYELMPKVALFCNIIVVTGGCYVFYKSGHIKFKKILPFVIGSIPMAYVGGSIQIKKEIFLFLLAITLIIASANMVFFNSEKRKILKIDFFNILQESNHNKKFTKQLFGLISGAVIGFVAGLVGIGGGIFLAPLLYMTRWSYAKQISATSSFFILVNSIAGLAGQFSKGFNDNDIIQIIPLMIAVFIGGQIGSRLGAFRLSDIIVERATGILIMFTGLRILYKLAV
jgi:hypothetical protein